jgi:triacylglycerol lipase
VFVPHLSATHSNETRGEQLLAQIERVLEGTGAKKVNLIGHSQGALAARYAGAVAPQCVASVTSVSGPNHGSELADFLRKALTPGGLPEHVAETVATLFADFLSLLSGHRHLPQNAIAALNALSTEGVSLFNDKYPQGLPETWGGKGGNWSTAFVITPGAASCRPAFWTKGWRHWIRCMAFCVHFPIFHH